MYLKATNADMTSNYSDRKYVIGLNIENNFNNNPSVIYGEGIHFCEAPYVAYWAHCLNYSHICDANPVPGALTITLPDLSRTNKLGLSSPIPIEKHPIWNNNEICLASVSVFGLSLQYVKNQTPEICLAAVQNDPFALIYVQKQTPEICLEAVQKNGTALKHVKKQTHEICLSAVWKNGFALEYVEKQTPQICMGAVQQDGRAIQFVKYQTPEICQAALRQDDRARFFIKDDDEEFICP
jgi:hypothetical protein